MDKRDPNQNWNKGMIIGRQAKEKKAEPAVKEKQPEIPEDWRCAVLVEEPAIEAMPVVLEKKKPKNQQGLSYFKNKKHSAAKKKTPLQEFDVRAFFEEHLDDIIDLEENHSGIREFEDSYLDE